MLPPGQINCWSNSGWHIAAPIARALINQPPLILADEPTGNLDRATGDSIITLFQQLNREGITIVVVTHNEVMARAARRQIALQDGKIFQG